MFPDGAANVVLAGPGAAANLPERAWHLSDWPTAQSNEQGVAVAEGWADFQEPTVSHQWFSPAQMHGAMWLGAVAEPRRFQLPVTMHATRTKSFEVVRDEFFSDIDFHTPSRLYINSPSGTVWLDVRMEDKPVVADVRYDDAISQEQDYLIPLVSEQSHYAAPEVVRTWVEGRGWDPSPELWNFGDLPEWPVWTLRGPGVFTIPDIAPKDFKGLEGWVLDLLPEWLKDLLRMGQILVDGQTTVVLFPGETMVLTGDPMQRLAVSDMRENAHRWLGGQRPLYQVLPHQYWRVDKLRVEGGIPGVTSAVVQLQPRRRRPW
ncbi:hypothetical protein [Corynebacterium sp. H113]|uniref:hypothetical protein n=1 Tax=Corynebacterium sp. H113 TaxID=3133419 RepID=UPI0030AE93F0